MKVGEPIDLTAIPPAYKYTDIWEHACGLQDGKALPVEADTNEEARNIAHSLRGAKDRQGKPLKVKQRGRMVWVWREGTVAPPPPPPDDPKRRREPD